MRAAAYRLTAISSPSSRRPPTRSRHTNLTNLQRQQQQQEQSPPPLESPPQAPSSIWADAIQRLQQQEPSPDDAQAVDAAIKPLRALRWANVGQNYDWARRRYAVDVTRRPAALASASASEQEDGDHHEPPHAIPRALQELVRAVAEPLGFPGMAAEAGIVNFYPADASMGGTLFFCLFGGILKLRSVQRIE